MVKLKKIFLIMVLLNNLLLLLAVNVKVVELLRKKYFNSEFILVDLNNILFVINFFIVLFKLIFWIEIELDYWIDKFKEIDILIFFILMINFNYLGVLKNFIDLICVVDKFFIYKYVIKGVLRGLIDKLKVIIVVI